MGCFLEKKKAHFKRMLQPFFKAAEAENVPFDGSISKTKLRFQEGEKKYFS